MNAQQPVHVANWHQLERETVRPGVSRSAFGNDKTMLVRNVLEPGMDINPHVHDFDQIALIVEGHAVFYLDGEEFDMPAGSALLIPAGVTHHATPVGDRPAVNIDVFSPPREDFTHLVDWMKSPSRQR